MTNTETPTTREALLELLRPGFDRYAPAGGTWEAYDYACLRVVLPNDVEEPIDLIVWDRPGSAGAFRTGWVRYQVRFDASTPVAVIDRAIEAAGIEANR